MKTKNNQLQSGFLGSRFLHTMLLCATPSSILAGTLLAFLRPDVPAKVSHRTVTFEERVAHQRAIEEVYWRHRIWPKERPDPKPSLDAVMSRTQLEKKVTDYLRNSQALEDDWQQPITAEQLQAEMERMAQHTKQPEVLRELFQTLGNDPFLIAECLARPVLSERMAAKFYADDKEPLDLSQARPENQIPKLMAAASANYTLPTISDAPNGCIDDTWTATSTTNAPTARSVHTAVWTGSEMIVWGGLAGPTIFNATVTNTGGRYNPSTDSWTATSTTNAPTARYQHAAVWTGTEMIVWGGGFNTGGRYNPSTDSWRRTSTTNAPTARGGHTAVWTGSEMIVWGGYEPRSDFDFNTGGRYDPGTDSWTATSTTNAPSSRSEHTAVWTGSEMIIWGGQDSDGDNLNTGVRYNPGTDSWTATSTTNAPEGRSGYTAVWTGSEMIVWGGRVASANVRNFYSGGRYNPSTDSWTATSTTNVPEGRSFHTAVWTGSEMIVWGGNDSSQFFSVTPTNTGGRYDPGTDSWTATSTTNAPSARDAQTAVWTGSEMIVWGGSVGSGNFFNVTPTNTGGRYCAAGLPPQLSNISTRAFVQTGDNVTIGGFIIQGTESKRVIIRAIGPDLTQYGVPNVLADPTLELHDRTGALIASNNNWVTTIIGGIITANQVQDIQSSGYAPGDGLESAIIADLAPGNYTAIVRGVNNMTGVALVEVDALSGNASSILANISTRSFVQTGDKVMIGGVIVQGTEPKRVIIRAIGPELTQYGIPNALANPTLELHDGTGALIASNDNWQTTIMGGIITSGQVSDIQNSGLALGDARESAILANLPPGNYTAIVRGVNNTSGVALVEVYALN
jgi:N-acetylneuraminic acid mutarotase